MIIVLVVNKISLLCIFQSLSVCQSSFFSILISHNYCTCYTLQRCTHSRYRVVRFFFYFTSVLISGAPETEGTEPAPRAWRGAGVAPVKVLSNIDEQSSYSNRALTIIAIGAIVYCTVIFWKRYGRKMKRRKLISLAT